MTPPTGAARPPAVAGAFYPAEPEELLGALDRCFDGASRPPSGSPVPAALIVPHAGYRYSGPVAASAYRRIEPARSTIRQVVLLGPSHRVPLRGLALSHAETWTTPLGPIPVDAGATAALAGLPRVGFDDDAHKLEHSLEVQLPFLQATLEDGFALVPLVVGAADADEVAAVIEALWTGPDTLVLVSTDLSHYHRHDDAVRLDRRTAEAIVARRPEHIADADACGARALRGLLRVADRHRLEVERLDLRNSGDTAGDRQRVVGYGAFAVTGRGEPRAPVVTGG